MTLQRKTRIVSLLRTSLVLLIGLIIGVLISFLSNWTITANSFIAPAVALVVGISVPFINAYFISRPKLSIEISSIIRKVSDENRIQLDEYDEFKVLKYYMDDRRRMFIRYDDLVSSSDEKGFTLVQLTSLVERARRDLKELPSVVTKRKEEYENINKMKVETFTVFDADRLNDPVPREIDVDGNFDDKKEEILARFKELYKQRLESIEKRLSELQNGLPGVERRLELITDDLLKNKSQFYINATLMNSGRLTTSIKKPALLRVYIGQGNYIDLKLELKDYDIKSEINTLGTKIVEFESSRISDLPEDDKKLINTYWGQSVKSILFLEDIYSNIHISKPISFAEGLYQKMIYDELAAQANVIKK